MWQEAWVGPRRVDHQAVGNFSGMLKEPVQVPAVAALRLLLNAVSIKLWERCRLSHHSPAAQGGLKT